MHYLRRTHWPSFLWGAGMTGGVLGLASGHIALLLVSLLFYAAGFVLEHRQLRRET